MSRRRSPLRLLPFVLLAGACAAEPDPRPNLLLVTLDTTRADHLSVYGYHRPTTPVLDAFAREGAKFERAFAPIATTGPSHSTIFTSLYPLAHRVVKNGIPLSDERVTLAETLREHGYQTAAIVSSFVLTRRFGFSQGFEHFEEDFPAEGASVADTEWEGRTIEGGFDRRADDATARALRWLEEGRDAGRPFFLFVHYFDPHTPYDPPPEFRFRFLERRGGTPEDVIARYDEEIAFTDQEIGVLFDGLERLGLADRTIAVVTADHGEGLGQHGNAEHGLNVYEEAVHVPLLVRWPGRVPAGSVHEEPVEFVDLFPTLLDLVGVSLPDVRMQGRSLAGALLGDEELDPERPVFLHRRHYEPGIVRKVRVAGEKYAVRKGRWKLIIGPAEDSYELYDLEQDPEEKRNRYEREPEVVAELRALLDDWRAANPDLSGGTPDVAEEDRAGLEALGYTE